MPSDRPVADLVIDRADVGGALVTVEVAGATVTYCGPARDVIASERVDAGGGAVLPGLHDHHIHLLATAALASSVVLGAGSVEAAMQAAAGPRSRGEWVRAVGYHEDLTGGQLLDRAMLDEMVPHHPIRVQHRTGMLWVLNSAALATLPADLPAGAEQDDAGVPNGRFWREDRWLQDHTPADVPDVQPVLRSLLARGVTSVTDMTPFATTGDWSVLAAAVAGSDVRVIAAGSPALAGEPCPSPLSPGPVKLVFDEADLPTFDDVVTLVAAAHSAGKVVAVHCVTRAVLAYAVAAFESAGTLRGDRIEHGAVVPPDLEDAVRRLGLAVVTQPGFLCTRGEQYRRDVDADDLPHLWPCRSLLDAGIPVAGSSDAPYGPLDPWLSIATAVTRRTQAGEPLGEHEAVDAATALGLWLAPPGRPEAPPRRVEPGAPADLCILDRPLAAALTNPAAVQVLRTVTPTRPS